MKSPVNQRRRTKTNTYRVNKKWWRYAIRTNCSNIHARERWKEKEMIDGALTSSTNNMNTPTATALFLEHLRDSPLVGLRHYCVAKKLTTNIYHIIKFWLCFANANCTTEASERLLFVVIFNNISS